MRNIVVFILSLVIVSWIHFQVLQNYKIKHHVAIKQSKIKQQIIQIQMASIATPKPIIKPVKEPEIQKQELPKLITKSEYLKKYVKPELLIKPIIPKIVKKLEIKPKLEKPRLQKESIVKKTKKIKILKESKKPLKKKPTKKRRKVTKHKATSLAMRQKKSSTGKVSKNRYLSKVRRIIERHKRYPRVSKRLGEQGVVYVRFTIASNGAIKRVSITRTSRHSRLNKAATKILRNIGSFPPIPKSVGKKSLTITLPIRYKL